MLTFLNQIQMSAVHRQKPAYVFNRKVKLQEDIAYYISLY